MRTSKRCSEKTGAYAALEELAEVLDHECTLLEIEHGIYERVKERMDKNQRDYFLREQMRVIQDELGEMKASRMKRMRWRRKSARSKTFRRNHVKSF